MTQHMPLDYTDVVHEGFFDAIQELLGASIPNLRVKVSNSTTLTISAASGNGQNSVAVDGLYRWVTGTVNASLPGGLTNGTGLVFVTAADNDFTGAPANPDVATDYSFALEIRASGVPTTDVYRSLK